MLSSLPRRGTSFLRWRRRQKARSTILNRSTGPPTLLPSQSATPASAFPLKNNGLFLKHFSRPTAPPVANTAALVSVFRLAVKSRGCWVARFALGAFPVEGAPSHF